MLRLPILMVAACAVSLLSYQPASSKTMWADNLRGLKSFRLTVEEPSADVRDTNCTQQLIATAAEQKLAAAHVPPPAAGVPTSMLSVTVTGMRVTSKLTAYNTTVEVLRTINLDGNERTVIVWADSALTVTNSSDEVIKSVGDLVDEFAGEWSRANAVQ